MKPLIKRLLPESVLATHRQRAQEKQRRQLLESIPQQALRLYELSMLTDYSHIVLSSATEWARSEIENAAREIYGDEWNFYSDALRPEIVKGFVDTIEALQAPYVNYLEIGSCQGLSMSLIGLLLKERRGSLISIDPYFESGYLEGGPYQNAKRLAINKETKTQAMRLYEGLNLSVTILEMTSVDGLRHMIQNDRCFHLIYIDGSHEGLWPMVDFGMAYATLEPGGVIILDDHLWPDVEPVKRLCDTHGAKIQETWKTASYRF